MGHISQVVFIRVYLNEFKSWRIHCKTVFRFAYLSKSLPAIPGWVISAGDRI